MKMFSDQSLEGSPQRIQQSIQDREREVKVLQQEVEAINHCADQTVEHSEKIFTDLIRLLEKRRFELKQQIRSQQETEVSRVQKLQEELQQEITELRRKEAELDPPLPPFRGSPDPSGTKARLQTYFKNVTAAVSALRDRLQDVLRGSETFADVEPETRAHFLQWSRPITLDPNSAHQNLLLSEGDRKVTLMSKQQLYRRRSARFSYWQQVLGAQALTGRCYWEVRWSGTGAYVAVSHGTGPRDGPQSGFGRNDTSWALLCYMNTCTFLHNNSKRSVSGSASSRIGVFLDHGAGTLSFYAVSGTMRLLHRVQNSFTEPLHAGVSLIHDGDSAEFCTLQSTEPA